MQESTLVPDVLHSRTQAVHSGDVPWRRPVAFVALLLYRKLLGLRMLGAYAGRLPQSGLWQRFLQAVGPFGDATMRVQLGGGHPIGTLDGFYRGEVWQAGIYSTTRQVRGLGWSSASATAIG
jgi:hypothetical protein